MSARSFSISEGSTLSATGGTGKTFAETGVQIPSGCNVADNSVADQRLRPNVTTKVRPIKQNADGSFTKGKVSMTLVRPKLRANGSVAYPLFRVEVEDDAETTAAELTELWSSGAQLCFDSELANLRAYKSLNT